MKRCPQCEFLYEDEQSLCDMDGILLVYDSRQFPHSQALSTTTTQLTAKAGSRKNKVPALATVVLATLLALVYYVSTQSHTSQATYTPPATSSSTTVAAPDSNVAPADSKVVDGNSNDSNGVKTEESTKDSEANSKSNSDKPATDDSSARKKSTTKSRVAPIRPEQSPPPEKDSKVESFFKKTGRILKKPFKH